MHRFTNNHEETHHLRMQEMAQEAAKKAAQEAAREAAREASWQAIDAHLSNNYTANNSPY